MKQTKFYLSPQQSWEINEGREKWKGFERDHRHIFLFIRWIVLFHEKVFSVLRDIFTSFLQMDDEIDESDVRLVIEQAHVTKRKAITSLKIHNSDLLCAILEVTDLGEETFLDMDVELVMMHGEATREDAIAALKMHKGDRVSAIVECEDILIMRKQHIKPAVNK